MLITPLVRCRFDGNTLLPTHGAYPNAVRFIGLVAIGLQSLKDPYADVLSGSSEKDKHDGKGYEG